MSDQDKSPETPINYEGLPKKEETAEEYARRLWDIDVAKYLRENSSNYIDLLTPNQSKEGIINLARELGHTEIIKYLESLETVENNVNDSNKSEKTAIDIAKESGSKNIQNMLDSLRNSSDEVPSKPKKNI